MPKATKATLAKAKVMADAGYTPTHIGKSLGHDPKSIRTWLKSTDFNNPEIQQLIEKIKSEELAELHLIGSKARVILNAYLDEVIEGKKEPNPISITAVLDRTFQQRQILSGGATANISVHLFSRIVEAACKDEDDKKDEDKE